MIPLLTDPPEREGNGAQTRRKKGRDGKKQRAEGRVEEETEDWRKDAMQIEKNNKKKGRKGSGNREEVSCFFCASLGSGIELKNLILPPTAKSKTEKKHTFKHTLNNNKLPEA